MKKGLTRSLVLLLAGVLLLAVAGCAPGEESTPVVPPSPAPTATLIPTATPTLTPVPGPHSSGAMYRANLGRTGVYLASGVREFHEVAWKYQVDGRLITNLVVANKVAYFGLGFDWQGMRIIAVDSVTGQEKWRLSLMSPKNTAWPASISALAVADGTLYFAYSGDEPAPVKGKYICYFCAVDAATGQVRWKVPVGLVFGNEPISAGIFSPPAVVDGLAYLAVNDKGESYSTFQVYAFDARNGQQKWVWKSGRNEWGGMPPALAFANDVLCFPSSGGLYGLDRKSGQERWKFGGCKLPILVEGTAAYFTGGDFLFAVDTRTGQEISRIKPKEEVVDITVGNTALKMPLVPPLPRSDAAFGDGIIYYPMRDILYALDSRSGQKVWQFKAEQSISPPVIAGDYVYFFTDYDLYGVELTTGKMKWRFRAEEVLYRGGISEDVFQSRLHNHPVLDNGLVYFLAGCDYICPKTVLYAIR